MSKIAETLFVCLIVLAIGCVALQPKIASWNLPDELPPCQERYRGKQAFLTAAGPYRDRIVMCFKEADGKYGYYEVQVKKVKR